MRRALISLRANRRALKPYSPLINQAELTDFEPDILCRSVRRTLAEAQALKPRSPSKRSGSNAGLRSRALASRFNKSPFLADLLWPYFCLACHFSSLMISPREPTAPAIHQRAFPREAEALGTTQAAQNVRTNFGDKSRAGKGTHQLCTLLLLPA